MSTAKVVAAVAQVVSVAGSGSFGVSMALSLQFSVCGTSVRQLWALGQRLTKKQHANGITSADGPRRGCSCFKVTVQSPPHPSPHEGGGSLCRMGWPWAELSTGAASPSAAGVDQPMLTSVAGNRVRRACCRVCLAVASPWTRMMRDGAGCIAAMKSMRFFWSAWAE